jgi:hypothetical protein
VTTNCGSQFNIGTEIGIIISLFRQTWRSTKNQCFDAPIIRAGRKGKIFLNLNSSSYDNSNFHLVTWYLWTYLDRGKLVNFKCWIYLLLAAITRNIFGKRDCLCCKNRAKLFMFLLRFLDNTLPNNSILVSYSESGPTSEILKSSRNLVML